MNRRSKVNNPPNESSNPYPSNGASDVDIHVTLNWTGGDPDPYDTVTYDVYLGNTSSPPKVVSNQTPIAYSPGTLDCETTYYWQIVSWDNHDASTAGPIWDFTTKVNNPPNESSNPYPSNGASANEPKVPNPNDGATDVDIDADLIWECSDPDGHTLTYDVYLEANNPTPNVLVSNDQSETSYDPGTLDYEITYYWQIIASDEYNITEGPIWSFTTEMKPKHDLSCNGDLSWTNIEPGSTLTGYFTVENIGEPSSLLDWKVLAWPTWGEWTFSQLSGYERLLHHRYIACNTKESTIKFSSIPRTAPETDTEVSTARTHIIFIACFQQNIKSPVTNEIFSSFLLFSCCNISVKILLDLTINCCI